MMHKTFLSEVEDKIFTANYEECRDSARLYWMLDIGLSRLYMVEDAREREDIVVELAALLYLYAREKEREKIDV